MKLREIKDWVLSLPDDFLEYEAVNGEVGIIDDEYHYRIDKPITALAVDEESNEVIFLNDTDDDEIKRIERNN